MARVKVSVIISAKNEAARLEECFSSLAAQKPKFSFDVHLVDNNSSDETYGEALRLAAKQRRKFYVWKEPKAGAPAARNFGARKASGEILVFTNAGCTFRPGWLEKLVRPLLEETNYPLAAVGGHTSSAFRIKGRPNLWESYLDDLLAYWEKDRWRPYPIFLPWAPVCNFAVRADVFLELGGFDERWKTAAYDMDFCWRLSLTGFICGFAPEARAQHVRSGSFRALFRQMENYAYNTQSLVTTYERELKLNRFQVQKDRFISRSLRTLKTLKDTTSIEQARFRALDAMMNLAALKGALEAQFSGHKGDGRLGHSRRGITPKKLRAKISRGYAHLHKQGWCYWKNPGDVNQPGQLILLHPKTGERAQLPEKTWKIWEIKSERGQSEDAASALGEDATNAASLRTIDHLTLDLRTQRLLP